MEEEIVIPLAFFATVFGIFYIIFTTRNRERLALIEKGADAKIFDRNISNKVTSTIVLNLGLLLTGIGVGIIIAHILEEVFRLDEDVLYPSMIFTFSGLALLVGFYQTKKMQEKNSRETQ